MHTCKSNIYHESFLCEKCLFNAHIHMCTIHIHMYCHKYYISYNTCINIYYIKKAFFTKWTESQVTFHNILNSLLQGFQL